MYKTTFQKSKISVSILPRNGIMFLVLQQSNAKLTLPLWFCNVVRSCFTATMEWSCRHHRMVFLNGGFAEPCLISIIWINLWNSRLSAWLNGMLLVIKNLRICLLTLFWIYCFLELGKNFESGPVPVPLLAPFGIFGHFVSMWYFMIDVGAPFSIPARECWKICPQNLYAMNGVCEALS